jgi:hypothetical protein
MKGGDTFFVPSLLWSARLFLRGLYMETELLGIILGVVLPIYPTLFVIYQKIGRYDEIVEEFRKLRSEHESHQEHWHGN